MPTKTTEPAVTVPSGYRTVVFKQGTGEHSHLAVVMGVKADMAGRMKYAVWTYNFDDGGCHFGHYIAKGDTEGFDKAVAVFNRKCRNIGVLR